MNSIQKLLTLRRLQSTLKKNPNDTNALVEFVVLTNTLPDPDHRTNRKILNRVLSLEPTNQKARLLLLEMDRIEMGAGQSGPVPAIAPAAPKPKPAPVTAISDPLEKPLVSRYSIIHRIIAYPLVAIALVLMYQSLGDWPVFTCFGLFFLIFMIPVWFASAVVRVSNSGINMSRLFGIYRQEMEWSELSSMRPGPGGVGMRLGAADGRSISISSQMSHYPAIVEAVRRFCPDLFPAPELTSFDEAGFSAGSKKFQKTRWGTNWPLIFAGTVTVVFVATLSTFQLLPTILLGIVIYFSWQTAFYAIHTVKLEGNKLSAIALRRQRDVSAREIQDIRMVTQRNRRGVATQLIQVDLLDNTYFSFTGFPEGNERMYGFLRSWWNTYQNR